jgi:hypothetical protein
MVGRYQHSKHFYPEDGDHGVYGKDEKDTKFQDLKAEETVLGE